MSAQTTQCPNCQHTFTITDEQLALKKGYVRCGNCKTIFSAREALISSAHSSISSPLGNSAQAAKTSNKTDEGLLFDDKTGLDEAGKPIVDANHTPKISNKHSSAKSTKNLSTANDGDFDFIEDFDNIKSTVSKQPKKIFDVDKNETLDEAWLNDLLEEEKKNEWSRATVEDNKLTVINRQANSVSDMLDKLDVGVDVETPLPEDEYRKKVNERFAQQVASQSQVATNSAGMTIIWLLGSIFLALLLLAQYVIFNLDSLVQAPKTATQLTSICNSLSLPCNLPVADTTLIDAKTLGLSKARNGSNQTDMIFSLTNTTNNKVVYPNLKITLRSGNDVKSQFIVLPQNYVEKDNHYLMPNQIKPIKLRLDYPKSKFEQANIDLYY